jgi:ubiquinone/menaquinone biosynthesis C-methylase UbiE
MGSYDRFAPWFDGWQRAFGPLYADLVLPRVTAALAAHHSRARRVADLGSGTGDLAVALARRGFEVVGVDRSQPMLAIARAKARDAGLTIDFVSADLRDLALVPPADAAVCVYTVVNQLVEDSDLARAFAAVRRSLTRGGLFVFETNLPAAYERLWTGEETVRAGEAEVHRAHRRLPSGTIEAEVTIRVPGRADEHDAIVQRPWSDGEIENALAAAGLKLVAREAFDPFARGDEAMKALWSARPCSDQALNVNR